MSLVLVDANVLLRLIIGVQSASDVELVDAAKVMLDEAAAGIHEFTVTDFIVSEIVFVLTSPKQYGLERREAASRIWGVIGDDRFQIDGKDAVLTALERWATTPALSFVDCLLIERARAARALVASFDAAVVRNARAGAWAPSPA